MKKILSIVALASLSLGAILFAEQGKGGFANPSAFKNPKGGFQQSGELKISSVTEAKALPDDAIVVLRGYIVEQLSDDKYRFKDEVLDETIVIEIDEDDWKGLVVSPEDLIVIYGEMDKGLISTEVDVKQVHKAKPRGEGRQGGPAGKGARAAAGGADASCTACGCAASAAKK